MSAPTPPLSIAPMMDRTDRHYRRMMRAITRETLLYTEMITTGALLHGPRDHLLAYHPVEHPIAIQLGGDNPDELAECARIAVDHGYDEVNLNVGCPSSRVQAGCFGVSLMGRPEVVARCVDAMRAAVDVPVTVKHRIGFDEMDHYDDMKAFVDHVAATGSSDRFTVHARKAWLQGLSPKENRNVPPLRYAEVWRLKEERPDLAIEINGGIRTLDDTLDHLKHVDAVMIGRAAYDTPMVFAQADTRVFGAAADPLDGEASPRARVVAEMHEHIDHELTHRPEHARTSALVRHLMPLYAGIPGARRWRRTITEGIQQKLHPHAILDASLQAVQGAG